MTEQELFARICKGDEQALEIVYQKNYRMMVRLVTSNNGTEEEARDVTQDSFIQAYTKIGSLKKEITFGAWLKRIVINNSINAVKKRKNVTSEWNDSLDMIEEDLQDLDYQKYEAARIMDAIDKISEGCRTVLNLYLFEGYDHKEIGQILNISESASKAQYSKAKSKIRKVLATE